MQILLTRRAVSAMAKHDGRHFDHRTLDKRIKKGKILVAAYLDQNGRYLPLFDKAEVERILKGGNKEINL